MTILLGSHSSTVLQVSSTPQKNTTMADNGKVLRVLSIIQCVFGGLLILLVIVGIALGEGVASSILDVLLAITVSVAGGLGIAASSPARLNTPGRGLATACMVLNIIAASLSIIGFCLTLLGTIVLIAHTGHAVLAVILIVVLLFVVAEIVISVWATVCCARTGACGCCPQSQPQMAGQVVYVSNQGGAVPAGAGYVVVQGTLGTAGPVPVQPYPVANYPGMASQPMHMQPQAGMYPPAYSAEASQVTETKVPL